MTYHNEPGTSARVTDPYAGARQDHHRAVLSRVTQAAMSGLGATAIELRGMRTAARMPSGMIWSRMARRGVGATAIEHPTKAWRPMHYQTAGSGFPRANFPYRIPGQLGQTPPATTDASLRPPPVQDSGLSTGLKVGWGAVAVLAVGLFWFTASPPKSITGNARRRRRSAGGHHVPPVRTLSDDYLAHLLSRRDTLMKGDAAKLEREKRRRAKHVSVNHRRA